MKLIGRHTRKRALLPFTARPRFSISNGQCVVSDDQRLTLANEPIDKTAGRPLDAGRGARRKDGATRATAGMVAKPGARGPAWTGFKRRAVHEED